MSNPYRVALGLGDGRHQVVIVDGPDAADHVWAAWANLKWRRGLLFGGAVIDRAVKCACGRWARWFLGQCETCLNVPDWRDDPTEVAAFERDMQQRGWLPRAKASGE